MEGNGAETIPRRNPVEAQLYAASKVLYRITGHVPHALVSPYRAHGRPVYFVHNPKCAGSTIKAVLGCRARHTTHAWPRRVIRRATWEAGFFIVGIRDPFDRFLSSYFFHVKGRYRGKLLKRYGDALRALSPEGYLDFIGQFPENLGPQVMWTDMPGTAKPACDLILRHEDSQNWGERLRAAGVELPSYDIPSRNEGTRPAPEALAATLGLSDEGVARLRRRVEEVYAIDYERFGYPRLA